MKKNVLGNDTFYTIGAFAAGILVLVGMIMFGASKVDDVVAVTGTAVESSRAVDKTTTAAPVEYVWNGQTRQGFSEGFYHEGAAVEVLVYPETGDWYMGATSKIDGAVLAGLPGIIVALAAGFGLAYLGLEKIAPNMRRRARRREDAYREMVSAR